MQTRKSSNVDSDAPPPNRQPSMLAIIPSAVAFNVVVGLIIYATKIPLYLDSVGVITATVIAGKRIGVAVALLSFAISAMLGNPQIIFFSATPIAIAIYTDVISKLGGFRTTFRIIVSGIGMGVVASIVSAPIVALLFGGVTSAGSSAITAFFLATGNSLMKSVLFSGFACEPVDKTVQCLLAIWLVKSLPRELISKFHGGSLHKLY